MSAPGFDLFAPRSPVVLALLGARVGGVLLVAPVFSARTVPMPLRAAVLVVVTVLLQPVALARSDAAAALTPAAVLGETLVGFAIGLGAAVLVGAAELAGDVMAIQMGLSGAALFDPLQGGQSATLGQFTQLFAIALLLSLDAHVGILEALAASTRAVPVGAPIDATAGAGAMLSAGSALFALGLRIAAPVVAAVLIANVALAVLTRVAPQLNVLSVAFPIQIAIGLVTLAAALALIADFLGGWEAIYDRLLTHFLGALAPARP